MAESGEEWQNYLRSWDPPTALTFSDSPPLPPPSPCYLPNCCSPPLEPTNPTPEPPQTPDGTDLACESVTRLRGGKDLFDFLWHFQDEYGSEQLQLAQKENLNVDFGLGCSDSTGNDEIEAVRIPSEGTGEGVIACQAQVNFECSGKRKAPDQTPGGERRSRKTTGVRIASTSLDDIILETDEMRLEDPANHLQGHLCNVQLSTSGGERGNIATGVKIALSKEHILQTKDMKLKDAAEHLKVSPSTLKRVCRGYGIMRWPPRKEHELVGQTCPDEFHANVVQEQIPQSNVHTSRSSVEVKVRSEEGTIRFWLSYPWHKVELENQVKKRLELDTGTYNISYKDEDDELILIKCNEDLEECIARSSPLGTSCIVLFLKLK